MEEEEVLIVERTGEKPSKGFCSTWKKCRSFRLRPYLSIPPFQMCFSHVLIFDFISDHFFFYLSISFFFTPSLFLCTCVVPFASLAEEITDWRKWSRDLVDNYSPPPLCL